MKQPKNLYVFVSANKEQRNRIDRFSVRLIRFLSGSKLSHVAVGDGRVVLECRRLGDRFHRHRPYVLKRPALIAGFTVPVCRKPDLDTYAIARKRSVWPTILTWATRGRYPSTACVEQVKQILNDSGFYIPRRITTPVQMYRYLMDKGCKYEGF